LPLVRSVRRYGDTMREWREHDARSGPLLLGMVEEKAHEISALRREVLRLRAIERELRAKLAVMEIEVAC